MAGIEGEMYMKKFLAGCMAVLVLGTTACATKEETTKKNNMNSGMKPNTKST